MSEEYNNEVSRHYAAYRLPIHAKILKEALPEIAVNFSLGLDIGCGTGRSSKVLKAFSQQVIGIDPSTEMLAEAVN